MIQILHGENTVQSRDMLQQSISAARERGSLIARIDAKQLDIPLLEQQLFSQNLFGESKLIVIEELQSLPKSKKKDELIAMIAAASDVDIILWEKRPLTPTMLKQFSGARVQEFKVTNVLFQWLDTLSGAPTPLQLRKTLSLLQRAIQSDGDFMCLTMLVRQTRLLLQIKSNAKIALAPFMIGKLKKQTASFSLEQLLRWHHQLLQIDIGQKTSSSRLGVARELELLFIQG